MRLFLSFAAVTFALDQALKWFVVQYLDLKSLGTIAVFSPLLNLNMAWNKGINFGLFASHDSLLRWFLILLAVAISVWVAVWIRRQNCPPLGQIAAGLLVGGAIGNALDRVIYGAVADFLNMSCCGIENPYAFNVADIAIFAGALGLILWGPKDNAPPPKRRKTS